MRRAAVSRSAASLVPSVTDGSNPAVSPGRTPGYCHLLRFLFSSWLCSEDSFRQAPLSAPGSLCTLDCAKRTTQFTKRLSLHRNRSLLHAATVNPGLHLKVLFPLCSVFLSVCSSVSPSLPGLGSPGSSTAEQAADSMVTSAEDGRMREVEGGQGRGLMSGTAAAGVCQCTSR